MFDGASVFVVLYAVVTMFAVLLATIILIFLDRKEDKKKRKEIEDEIKKRPM